MQIMDPWIARVAPLLFSVALTVIYLAFNQWFGAGDLSAMIIWSIPFTLLVGAVVNRSTARATRRSRGWQLMLLGLGPALLGVGWVLVAALVLGPWIGAFSFPIAIIWMLAGVLTGMVVLARLDARARVAAGLVSGVLFAAYIGLAWWAGQ